MTSQEFTTWLKGFTEGVHEYNITPKQWDLLKERLAEVDDTIPMGGFISDPNTFKVPNDQGFFQTPSHHYGISSGTNVTYTTNGVPNWYSSNIIENDSREK
jgi:hypothetical protein